MRPVLLLFGYLSVAVVAGQGSFPFPTTDAIWKDRLVIWSTTPPIEPVNLIWTSYCATGQDTVINGHTYTVLDDCEGTYQAAIRDQFGQVMIVPADSASELLLHDTTIPAGVTDTLSAWDKEVGSSTLVVTGQGPDLNGRNVVQVVDGYTWIEGIGNTSGLLGPNQVGAGPAAFHLDCMSVGDTTYYPYLQQQACVPYTAIAGPSAEPPRLYPVPAEDILHVELLVAGPVRYEVLDLLGQLVLSGIWMHGERTVPVQGLADGPYVIGLRTAEGVVAPVRFVVAR